MDDGSYLPREYLHLVGKRRHDGKYIRSGVFITPDEDTKTGVSKRWVVGAILRDDNIH